MLAAEVSESHADRAIGKKDAPLSAAEDNYNLNIMTVLLSDPYDFAKKLRSQIAAIRNGGCWQTSSSVFNLSTRMAYRLFGRCMKTGVRFRVREQTD